MTKKILPLMLATAMFAMALALVFATTQTNSQIALAIEQGKYPAYTEETVFDETVGQDVITRTYLNVNKTTGEALDTRYGSIKKGFIAPSGYYLAFEPAWESRQVENEITNAITSILKAEREAGYNGELEGNFHLYFKTSVPKEQKAIYFKTYGENDKTVATEYPDTHETIEIDELVEPYLDIENGYKSEFRSLPWSLFEIEPLLLEEVYKATDILAYAEVNISIPREYGSYENAKSYKLRFNFPTTHVEPVTDGTLISLKTLYCIDPEMGAPYIDLRCEVNTLFANADDPNVVTNIKEYKVEAMSGNLPSSGEWALTVDGSININMDDNYMLLTDLPTDPFTLQAIFYFETRDGEKVALKTNVVTIQNHTIDLKIDGLSDLTIGFDTTHTYSVVLDKNNTPIKYDEVTWDFSDGEYGYYEHYSGNNVNATIPSTYIDYEDNQRVTQNDINLDLVLNGEIDEFSAIKVFKRYDIEALAEPPIRVYPQYEIEFNVSDNDVAINGGEEFWVSASIENVLGDEGFKVSLTVSGIGAAVIESTNSTALLVPVEAGSVVLFAKAESNSVGTITKSLTFNVLDATAENTTISLPDGFVKTGSALSAQLSIGGYTNFLNYTPSWKVECTNDKGNVNAVDFAAVGNRVTLASTTKGSYSFALLNKDGALIASTQKNVADIDVQKVIIQTIPFVALVMVLGVIGVWLLRRRLSANKTIDGTMYKLAERLAKQSQDMLTMKTYTPQKLKNEMRPVISTLANIISHVGELNNETLGQYQSVYTTLVTAENIAKASVLCADKIDREQARQIFETLSIKFVGKAADVCKALREALSRYADSKVRSEIGVEVVNPNAQPVKHKHKKNPEEYLEMLTFFIHGDNEGDEDDEEN